MDWVDEFLIFPTISNDKFSDLLMQVLGMKAKQNAQLSKTFQFYSIQQLLKLNLFQHFSRKKMSRVKALILTGPNDK